MGVSCTHFFKISLSLNFKCFEKESLEIKLLAHAHTWMEIEVSHLKKENNFYCQQFKYLDDILFVTVGLPLFAYYNVGLYTFLLPC